MNATLYSYELANTWYVDVQSGGVGWQRRRRRWRRGGVRRRLSGNSVRVNQPLVVVSTMSPVRWQPAWEIPLAASGRVRFTYEDQFSCAIYLFYYISKLWSAYLSWTTANQSNVLRMYGNIHHIILFTRFAIDHIMSPSFVNCSTYTMYSEIDRAILWMSESRSVRYGESYDDGSCQKLGQTSNQ